MFESVFIDFLILFVTIDPVGTLSIFVGVTAGMTPGERPKVAVRAVLYGGMVLLGFLIVGEIVLTGMGVELVSFQLAGGIILFLFAIQMIFGSSPAIDPPKPEDNHDVSVFPLAIPSIANPGSILAVVILTSNDQFSISQQFGTAVVLLAVLAITLVALLQANRISRVIGNAGAAIMIRVMGLLLAALAAEYIVSGLEQVLREFAAN